MAGHLFSFPDSARKRPVADGATVTKVFVGAVRPRESTKRPPFYYARKSVSFRGSRYVDTIAGLEQVRSLNLLPDLKLRHIVQTKFLQNLERALAGLGHMALLRLVDSLILLAAEAHLDGAVAVFGIFLFLHDNARAGLDNRDRNDISFRTIELRHANLFANKTCHKSFRTKNLGGCVTFKSLISTSTPAAISSLPNASMDCWVGSRISRSLLCVRISY